MGILIGVGVVVAIIAMWFISTSNKLNIAIVKIDEADSGIDVALTKRHDVLVKMLDTVKGYTKHEKDTLKDVVQLRSGMTTQEKITANEEMSKQLSQLQIMVENYPELKASENFKSLQLSITDVEEHLQAARRLFNSNVSSFNQMIVTFPTSIIANMKALTKKDFFEATEEEKKDVKMEF